MTGASDDRQADAVVTKADRATAAATLNYAPDEQVSTMDQDYVDAIAAALAAEREKARAAFLALADRLDTRAKKWLDERRPNDDPAAAYADGSRHSAEDAADAIRTIAEMDQ